MSHVIIGTDGAGGGGGVRDRYEQSITNVESNDTLYGGDPRFFQVVDEEMAKVVDALLNRLQALGADESTEVGRVPEPVPAV